MLGTSSLAANTHHNNNHVLIENHEGLSLRITPIPRTNLASRVVIDKGFDGSGEFAGNPIFDKVLGGHLDFSLGGCS